MKITPKLEQLECLRFWGLMLHKTREYHNKFDYTKALRVYYWYSKIP